MDWVKAKADWTPEKALAALSQRMQADIEAWRGIVGEKKSSLIRVQDFHPQNVFSELTVERFSLYGMRDRWLSIALASNEGVKYRFSPDGEELILFARLNRDGEPRLRLGGLAATEDERREQGVGTLAGLTIHSGNAAVLVGSTCTASICTLDGRRGPAKALDVGAVIRRLIL